MYCKMRSILLLALSVIVLSQSFGVAYAVHVSGHLAVSDEGVAECDPCEIVTVSTDSMSYETGEVIEVSGSIYDYNESDPFRNHDVTLRLTDPNNNIINISQLPLDGGGYFSSSILAEGPLWKFDGDYTIFASHGNDRNAVSYTHLTLPTILRV